MDRQVVSRFFLGANSPGGFKSLYDNFTDPSVDCLRILKGGPGCGKSTFMKRVGAAAEERGLSVEYIHCSGDPDSLDGVYIPALRLAYADGTSPHVIEPSFAGSEASYINFGAFYDLDMLRREREGIRLLTEGYKAQYNRASAPPLWSGPPGSPPGREPASTPSWSGRGSTRRCGCRRWRGA